MENIIYQVEMLCGYGDEHYCDTIYVGTDHNKAKEICNAYTFPSEYNQFGKIVHWDNGKKVKEEYIRE